MSGRTAGAVIAATLLLAACGSASLSPSPSPAASAAVPTLETPTSGPSPTLGPPAPLRWDTFPEPPSRSLSKSTVGALDKALLAAVDGHDRLGAAAGVIVGGQGVWFGVAGQGLDGVAVTAASTWSTGSIAKTVVAAQVLRLAERGVLRLEDPAAALLPAGSGLETNGASVADLLRMRSGIGAHRAPGTTFEYRNGDYMLLGSVIEAVTGRRLGAVLTGDILDVRGAEGLRFPDAGSVDNAAGPFDADAPSLARWGYELFGRRLVDDGSLSRMVDFGAGEYGMGVFDFSVDFGDLAVGHLGQDPPWSAALVALPSRQTVIVVLMNADDVLGTEGVAVDLARLARS
jgi:D-alanyl-D-alanine carboxypeptidase